MNPGDELLHATVLCTKVNAQCDKLPTAVELSWQHLRWSTRVNLSSSSSLNFVASCRYPSLSVIYILYEDMQTQAYSHHLHATVVYWRAFVRRLSVRPIVLPPHAAPAGLLLWARRAGDIDRQRWRQSPTSSGAAARRSATNASSVTHFYTGSWTQTCCPFIFAVFTGPLPNNSIPPWIASSSYGVVRRKCP